MSTNTKHTAEPWHVSRSEDQLHMVYSDADRQPVANCGHGRLIGLQSQEYANAARIVACVNALAGCADPADFVRRARAAGVVL